MVFGLITSVEEYFLTRRTPCSWKDYKAGKGIIIPPRKVSRIKKNNLKNLKHFFILFEIKTLESDVTYFIPFSSSLIFFHFPRTEFQSRITTVAGTN